MFTYVYYDLQVSGSLYRYGDCADVPQPLERAYDPTGTVRPWPLMYPPPMPPHVHYTYPPYGESTVYLIPGPNVTGNEQPAEEGGWKKYLSMAVEALNAVATIIGACMQ
jgi:hypothetical protein